MSWLLIALLACTGGTDTDPTQSDTESSDTESSDTEGSDTESSDTESSDTESSSDTETSSDTEPPTDTEDTEASVPTEGYGDITGDCGELDDELTSSSPSIFVNVIDLEGEPDTSLLTEGGQEIYADGNLGGSSIWSEVFSFEVLARCELATLLKTEGEIDYDDTSGKKTDLLVTLDALTIGVSVTRAYKYPPTEDYTVEDATDLLEDKLADVLLSSANVSEGDAWNKQILHVVAYAEGHAESIEAAWAELDGSITADTIVWVTVTDGDDEFLY